MNEQNIPQPNELVQSSKNIWITIIAVALTAVIVGGGVYTWQKSSWTTTTNQQLSVRFKHPADVSVSFVNQRQTSDGTTINELIVTPAGMDSTRVHFFTTSAPIDQAKNIQIYGASSIENSEFVSATIDGRAGTRRVDYYLNNDCTNELTVAEKNGVVYGFHIVQCPTHQQGYDKLRKDIADSLEFL